MPSLKPREKIVKLKLSMKDDLLNTFFVYPLGILNTVDLSCFIFYLRDGTGCPSPLVIYQAK